MPANSSTMTSRERMLATMQQQPVDHLPLLANAVMFAEHMPAIQAYPDPCERASYYAGLGLDCGVAYHSPFSINPKVIVRNWQETPADECWPVLHKEYETERGVLRQVVRKTDDYGADTIPIFHDHNMPASRSIQYLVEHEDDLDKLECVLGMLSGKALETYRDEVLRGKRFCEENGLTCCIHNLGIGDPIMWMSGVERTLEIAMCEKEFLHRYVNLVAAWQKRTLEFCLDLGVHHITRRGWYESTDFWSPSLYEEFLLEPLREQVDMIHQAGATITYTMASGSMPLLDQIKRSGVDMLCAIDPAARDTDIPAMRARIGDSVALCGGVNNYCVLERGSEDDVRRAVRDAIDVFTPPIGCVLASSDVIGYTDRREESWALADRNFHVMVETWRSIQGQ